MSKYVLPRGKFASIRVREQTKYFVVHFVNVSDIHSQCSNDDEFLWALEARARDESIYGHGVHFIVLPDGSIHRDRPIELFGSLNRQWNRSSIFVRVPVIGEDSEPTQAQEEALLDLIEELEAKYPKAGYKEIYGWGELQV